VTYPPDVPAHTVVQKLSFDAEGMLKRLNSETDAHVVDR
jgi:hypothetical protein